MAVERKKATVALGVVTLVAALALSTLTVSAGASSRAGRPLCRARRPLYTSGTAWGPFTNFNPLRRRLRDRHGRAALRDALPLRPAEGQVHPVARDERQVGRQRRTSSRVRRGVTWNDGKPLTAADVKFTFETGKLEGSELSTMWKTGLTGDHDEGQRRQLPLQGHAELPGLGLRTLLGRRSSRGTSGRGTARRRSRPATPTSRKSVGTGPFKYGAGKGTSRRSSGTGVTAGGRRRRSACGCR